MPEVPSTRTSHDKQLPELLSELWELIRAYVRQETLDPIKGVGKWVAFGVAGALLVGMGVVFLAVAVLRILQTETDTTFTGNWSWAPYLIVFAALAIGGGLTVAAIDRGTKTDQPAKTGKSAKPIKQEGRP
ncbi:MAG TPA: phage holin family protein [Acidimicrobiia bacterium]|nr:phage holin family protein [Acidimicrobiia bacterium]